LEQLSASSEGVMNSEHKPTSGRRSKRELLQEIASLQERLELLEQRSARIKSTSRPEATAPADLPATADPEGRSIPDPEKLLNLLLLVADNVPDMLWAKDMENRYLFTNPAIRNELLMCEPDEPPGKNDLFFAERERAAGYQHTFGEICANSDEIVKKQKRPGVFLEDGLVRNEYLALDVHKAPLRNTAGEMIGTVGAARDVTAVQRIQQELAATLERFELVLESMDVGVCVVDLETHEILFINKYLREKFGDLKGKTCWQTLQSGQSGPCSFCTNDQLVDTEGNPTGVVEYEHLNTYNNLWYFNQDQAIRWTDGRLVRFELATEITSRREAADALKRSNAILNSLSYTADRLIKADAIEPVIDEVLARLGKASEVNRVYIFRRHSAADGRNLFDQLFEWTSPGVSVEIENPELQDFSFGDFELSEWEDIFLRGDTVSEHVGNLAPKGREMLEAQQIRSICLVPIMLERALWGFIGFDQCHQERNWTDVEINALKTIAVSISAALQHFQDRSALAEKTTLLDNILRSSTEMAIITNDLDYRITYCNTMAEQLFGYPAAKLIGKTPLELYSGKLINPSQFEDAIAQVKREGEFRFSIEQETPDGIRYVDARVAGIHDAEGELAGYSLFARNITRQKESERIMLKASRMEATATLAAGIAHDFNNLMVGVLGNAELAKMRCVDDAVVSDMLNSIAASAGKAGDLAQQLLAYARGGKYQPRVISLNEVVEDVISLNERSFPPRIRIERHLEPDLANTLADPTQLTQVVMNLCLNSVEAIEESGYISIATSNVVKDPAFKSAHPDLTEPEYICLTVTDNGAGMDPDTLLKIFEPFFSSKFQGRGLGLAAVYGIINNHRGEIAVNSTPGKGTCFDIYLPATREPKPVATSVAVENPTGDETVMVIDDDPNVIAVAQKILENLGYQVLTAVDGRAALLRANEHKGPIDLVLLDMEMPVMGGSEVAPLLKELYPDLKIVICSGYELDAAAQDLLDRGADSFVQKPFRLEVLAHAVRKALDVR